MSLISCTIYLSIVSSEVITGACVATTLSAPAWAGVAVVGSAIVLVSKLINAKASGPAAKEV